MVHSTRVDNGGTEPVESDTSATVQKELDIRNTTSPAPFRLEIEKSDIYQWVGVFDGKNVGDVESIIITADNRDDEVVLATEISTLEVDGLSHRSFNLAYLRENGHHYAFLSHHEPPRFYPEWGEAQSRLMDVALGEMVRANEMFYGGGR